MKKAKQINYVFIALICATVLAYGVQAVQVLLSRSYVLWSYAQYSINAGALGRIMNFLKDGLAILLLLMLAFTSRRNMKTVIVFLSVVAYGILFLVVNHMNVIAYTIAGIREYVFFVVAVMYCQFMKKQDNQTKWQIGKWNDKALRALIVIEFICWYGEVLNSGNIIAGGGAYRFCGTFGNAGVLGAYCIGMNMYLCAYTTKREKKKKTVFMMVLVGIMTLISGMRSAMLCVLLMDAALFLQYVYRRFHMNKKSIGIALFFVCLTGGSAVISQITKFSARGNIMVSGSTRLNIFADLFSQSRNIRSLLFGYGIGYGTNSAVNLSAANAFIADGTLNTTIAQFGLTGLILFLICAVFLSVHIIQKTDQKLMAVCDLAAIWLLFVTGNYFEQFVLVILSVYTFYILQECSFRVIKRKRSGNDKEKHVKQERTAA